MAKRKPAPPLAYFCQLCGETFLRRASLDRHLREGKPNGERCIDGALALNRTYEAARRAYREANPFPTREELAEREEKARIARSELRLVEAEP